MPSAPGARKVWWGPAARVGDGREVGKGLLLILQLVTSREASSLVHGHPGPFKPDELLRPDLHPSLQPFSACGCGRALRRQRQRARRPPAPAGPRAAPRDP